MYYSPVRHSHHSEEWVSFDLHVLGMPPAFVLSQDQTLKLMFRLKIEFASWSLHVVINLLSYFYGHFFIKLKELSRRIPYHKLKNLC
jgi:hypothetical protein